MIAWINYEAPAFTGTHFYRVWSKKPIKRTSTGWYDKRGGTRHSFIIQCELMEMIEKECHIHLKKGLNLVNIEISRPNQKVYAKEIKAKTRR